MNGRYQGPKAYNEALRRLLRNRPYFRKTATEGPVCRIRPTRRMARQWSVLPQGFMWEESRGWSPLWSVRRPCGGALIPDGSAAQVQQHPRLARAVPQLLASATVDVAWRCYWTRQRRCERGDFVVIGQGTYLQASTGVQACTASLPTKNRCAMPDPKPASTQTNHCRAR